MLAPGTKQVKFVFNKTLREAVVGYKFEWNMKGLSEFTYYRTYSRRKADGTLESFNECVLRVIEGMFTILKTHCKMSHLPWDEKQSQKMAFEAAERMFQFKWLPPGRGLWMMGTDYVWERGGAALNNPLHVDTRVYTKEHGFIKLGDLNENDKVTVVARNKESFASPSFAEASVSHVEMQDCVAITYKTRFGNTNTVISSKNHRWWKKSTSKLPFERVVTTDLVAGDYLPRTTVPNSLTPSPIGIMHGYFFGDGTRSNGELHQFTDDKHDVLSRYFGDFVETAQRVLPSGLADKCVHHLPLAWGKLPTAEYLADRKYLLGFLMGYFAADGSSTNGQLKISSAREDELIQIASLFESIGIETKLLEDSSKSQFCEDRELWALYINREDVDETFFVRKNHLQNYQPLKSSKNYHKIIEIVDVGAQPVKCLVVPDHENFMIEGFLTTSNCGYVSTQRMGENVEETVLPFKFLMDMSMMGVGVGFDTLGANNNVPVVGYTGEETFVVEDTRESWVDVVIETIKNGIFGGPRVVPDVSRVRDEGHPIRGFGGVSSGPAPLLMVVNGIYDVLRQASGKTIDSVLITDIQNLIGKCVVSGNVRRTAEIAFSSPDDSAFANMKNWSLFPVETGNTAPSELKEINPEEYDLYNKHLLTPHDGVCKSIQKKYLNEIWCYKFGGWRWTSNNSITATVGMEYAKFEGSIAEVGEPGFMWLDLMRKYGRLKDVANNKDYRVLGGNPCLEQSLESYELCCLVENFPSHATDYWDFQRTLKFSYLYAKAVTLLATHFDRTNQVIVRNRRIGCSVSGVQDQISKIGRTKFFTEWADHGYAYIQYVDKKYSEWLGVPLSIKTTSAKPSGTTSLVAGVFGPGMHFPKMRNGYRLVRISNNSELLPVLKEANYRVEPSVTDPQYTSVIYFPWLTPDHLVSEDDVTIWEQFKMAADLQYWWADNQVSCTVGVTKEEADKGQIAACLTAFDGQLKGISLLPKRDGVYKQMPFTKAPKEEVEAYMEQLKPLDFTSLTEEGENASSNKFCDGDSCQL